MHRERRRRWILAPLLAAVALSACGADPDPADTPDTDEAVDDTDTSEDTDATEDAAENGDAPGDEPAVAARNIAFEPAEIEVEVGTTVVFTNEDVVRHTVTSGHPGEPDGTFDEPIDDEGDTAMITFDEPGTFDYYCDLHRSMVGTVTVTE